MKGSRRDVLIRCPSEGSYALRTSQRDPMPMLYPAIGDDVSLLTFDVRGEPAPNSAPTRLPALPDYLPYLLDAKVDGRFSLKFIAMVTLHLTPSSTLQLVLIALLLRLRSARG